MRMLSSSYLPSRNRRFRDDPTYAAVIIPLSNTKAIRSSQNAYVIFADRSFFLWSVSRSVPLSY
jgi:hypothetical protein